MKSCGISESFCSRVYRMKIIPDIRTKYYFGRPSSPSVAMRNLISLAPLIRRTVTLKNPQWPPCYSLIAVLWYNRFDENHRCSNSETRRRRSAISSANHVNIWFVFFTIFLSFSLFRCFYCNTVRPSDAQHNKIPWTSGPMNILFARNFHRSSFSVYFPFPHASKSCLDSVNLPTFSYIVRIYVLFEIENTGVAGKRFTSIQ